MFRTAYIVGPIAALMILAGCRDAAKDQRVTVSAAASLSDVMRALAAAYEAEYPGAKVVINTGGSSTLARQIVQGAPVDIFISANPRQMAYVAAEGLVHSQSVLLSNTLVIVVPRGESTRDPLAGGGRIAIGDDAVPAGVYARAWLEQGGRLDAVTGRLVGFANVRQVLAAVQSGNAVAGFVYATDVASAGGGVQTAQRLNLPPGTEIEYPIALLARGKSNPAAVAFVEWLKQPAARKVFQDAGFLVK